MTKPVRLAAVLRGRDGIVLTVSGAIQDNAGTITGGAGGYAKFDDSGLGGAGGANTGVFPTAYSNGGAGGAGAVLLGGELCNLGNIVGGAGGSSQSTSGGAGGTGVIIVSGTLVAAAGGTISGGVQGAGSNQPFTNDAVVFGNRLPATLVVHPGATFTGGVQASASVADTLVLAGTASGTLSDFGEAGGMQDFRDIAERAGAHWTLSGDFTGTETLSLGRRRFSRAGRRGE